MLDWINLDGTWVQWVGHPITVTVLTVLVVGELITDQLPKTPSRTVPPQFIARLITGGFAGRVHRTAWGFTRSADWCGRDRRRARHAGRLSVRRKLLADERGNDLPVALTEDAVAVWAASRSLRSPRSCDALRT